jgi:serine/threonine protein kinase
MLSVMISGTIKRPEVLGIDMPTCIHIFKEIMTALAFVHSKNIAHRDLKTENVIYD